MPADPRVLAGKRVLVVEDEALIALMLEDMLSDLGAAEIDVVATVEEALASIDSTRIDAAIVDLNLAEGTSAAVTARLTADAIPYLIATGGSDRKDLTAPILAKPFTFAQLSAALGQL